MRVYHAPDLSACGKQDKQVCARCAQNVIVCSLYNHRRYSIILVSIAMHGIIMPAPCMGYEGEHMKPCTSKMTTMRSLYTSYSRGELSIQHAMPYAHNLPGAVM